MASYNSSKKPSVTPESIVRDVRAGNICPVYYLMGEEGYYIDKISEFLINTLLTKEEQDFNLVTFFGADAEIEQIIMAAKAFPMGAKYTVVLVKEAQALSDLDKFEFYLKQPQSTSVVIFCHMNGKIDRRLKVAAMIEKGGVLYESSKVKDGQLPVFIKDYLKRKGCTIEPEAAV